MKKIFNKFLSILPGNSILTLDDIEKIVKGCEDNNLEQIKSIFQERKIRLFSLPCKKLLNLVSDRGYTEIFEYLLSSSDTKEFQNTKLDEALILACLKKSEGGVQIAKYILSSTQLRKNIDMDKLNEHVLLASCRSMNIPIIKFILEDSELSSYIDIHHNNDEVFKYSFYSKEMNFIHYLIFDKKITRTKDIDELLKNEPNQDDLKAENKYTNHMFDIRKMNKELHSELKSVSNISKTKVVKL